MNNLYGYVMSQKLPVNNFEWTSHISQFNECFIKTYKEESDKGYFIEVHIQYIDKLHEIHNHLPFLPGRMEIEKVQKLVANLRDKTESVIHIGNLEQVSNYGLVIIIKWLSLIKMLGENYIDINTDLRKKAKNDFENIFLKVD